MRPFKLICFSLVLPLILSSCMSAYIHSVGGNTSQVFERTYFTDFQIAWESALEVLKNSQMQTSNKEGGFLQTKWLDNTTEKNFTDSFGDGGAYVKAQYRLKISLNKANLRGKSTVKIKVLKEQLVQRDVLDGWKYLETDSIEESTLLYRIGRMIIIKTKLAEAEDLRTKKELRQFLPNSR